MELSNLIKVIAAFVAGVVVALGGALIYVRASDASHHAPVSETIQSSRPTPPPQDFTPPQGQDASDQEPASPAPAAPQPVQKVQPKKLKALMPTLESHRHGTPARGSQPTERSKHPVQLAQSTPELVRREPEERGPVQTQIPGVRTPQVSIPGVNPTPPQATEPPPAQTENDPAEQNRPEDKPAPAPEPVAQPHVVTLQTGTNLMVRLGETLSTDHNYTGDTFRGTLESPIIMDGFIIADKGSKVLGRVVNAQKAGRIEGVSDLNLVLTEINTTDGQRVRVDTSTYDKRGPTSTGEDTAKIAGGAALGAIIGGVAGGGKGAAIGAGAGGAAGTGAVLVTRGKAAVLPTETRLTFRLASPVTITEKLNN